MNDRLAEALRENEDLREENARLRLWCDFRAQALYDILECTDEGSKARRLANAALCFGPERHPSSAA